MKHYVRVLALLLLLCMAASCDKSGGNESQETTAETTQKTTIAQQEATDVLSLIPNPQDTWNDYIGEYSGANDPYRSAYYNISGKFADLAENPDPWIYHHGELPQSEMTLVTFVKDFNIPKKQFEEATRRYIEHNIKHDIEMTFEFFEPPNPDILYTFDNEIINAYYRRENPVAPDWLGTERAKDFTYESYSAYLEANPE